MLPINFNFKLASSVENLGGVNRYPPRVVWKRYASSYVPRTSKFVGTKF